MTVHTLMIETAIPISMTCADGVGIPKGTLVVLGDPMTVTASAGDVDLIAGVTAAEKIASDGNTKVPVYREGVFKATAGGTVTVGLSLHSYSSSGDANDLINATASTLASEACGVALESASDGETFLYELCPGKATMNALA